MDKLKKLFVDHRHQVIGTIYTIGLIVGAFIATLTVHRYGLFVRAVLGLVVIYLFYLEYVVFKRTHDNEFFFVKFEFPKGIRHFVIDFFVVMIMVWAGVQVLDLIRYLINIFINR